MKIKLYRQFEHWYHGGNIWLFSDPHFNDPTSKEIDDNWPNSDDLVEKLNFKLGRKDTLICLGDVGDLEYVKKIKNCYKVLVMGNHDKGYSNYEKKYAAACRVEGYKGYFFGWQNSEKEVQDTIDEYNAEHSYVDFTIEDNRLFDEIYEGPIFISDKILLSHEPIELSFGLNIHGHSHGAKSDWCDGRSGQCNICSDVVNFEKIRLDDIVSRYKVESIHRQTIDRAVRKKKNKYDYFD